MHLLRAKEFPFEVTQLRSFKLLASAALLTVAGSVAHADIVSYLSGAPVQVAGGYQYTYDVSLSGGQLDATTNGAPQQFGTVYDFGTYTFVGSTGLLASSFNFVFENTSTAAFQTKPNDDPNLTNIRFYYTGSDDVVVAGQATTKTPPYDMLLSGQDNLGTFTVISPFNTLKDASYDGQSYKGTNDTMQGNVGIVSTPYDAPVTADAPEPSSLVLIGTGLLGTAAAFRRRF